MECDADVLRRQHRFVRDAAADSRDASHEVRMAAKYYERLYKEYAVYACRGAAQDAKIGLRWRTRAEVLEGKGQFTCGRLQCDARACLHSYEVSFAYTEAGAKKHELVKVRACPACAGTTLFRREINRGDILPPAVDAALRERPPVALERKKRKRPAGEAAAVPVQVPVPELPPPPPPAPGGAGVRSGAASMSADYYQSLFRNAVPR